MTGKTRILVVEHETPLGMRMAFLLTSAGCEVQAAHTGRGGMELALEYPFDLIILSAELPDLSAFEICRKLKQAPASRTTPVIFVSTRLCEQNMKHGFGVGAADYIVSPFEATDFIFRIISQAKNKPSSLMALSKKETTGFQTTCQC